MKRIYAEVIDSEFPEGDRNCPMSEAEFKAALDPREILNRRKTSGSASPAENAAMIAEMNASVESFKNWTAAKAAAIDASIEKLECEFKSFL